MVLKHSQEFTLNMKTYELKFDYQKLNDFLKLNVSTCIMLMNGLRFKVLPTLQSKTNNMDLKDDELECELIIRSGIGYGIDIIWESRTDTEYIVAGEFNYKEMGDLIAEYNLEEYIYGLSYNVRTMVSVILDADNMEFRSVYYHKSSLSEGCIIPTKVALMSIFEYKLQDIVAAYKDYLQNSTMFFIESDSIFNTVSEECTIEIRIVMKNFIGSTDRDIIVFRKYIDGVEDYDKFIQECKVGVENSNKCRIMEG